MADQDLFLKYQSLPDALKKEVADFIDFLLQKNASQKELKQAQKDKPPVRKAGTMKGLITYMADDFDAPLEDFKDYM